MPTDYAALLQKQAEERTRFEQEAAARLAVPLLPSSTFAHKDETWLTYCAPGQYGLDVAYPLPWAIGILATFAPNLMVATMRDAGCLSIKPQAQQGHYADGKLRGLSAVSLTIEGGKGFGPTTTLETFVDIGGATYRIHVEAVTPIHVASRVTYGRDGEVTSARHDAPQIPSAERVKWGAGSPDAYRFSYHWPTWTAFLAWAEKAAQ